MVNGLVMLREPHRVASVMSMRPARRRALIARFYYNVREWQLSRGASSFRLSHPMVTCCSFPYSVGQNYQPRWGAALGELVDHV